MNNPDVITINIDKITAASRSNASYKANDHFGSKDVSNGMVSQAVSGRLHIPEDSIQLNSARSVNISKITHKP